MKLRTTLELYCLGTREGVLKEWDTRGRGRKSVPTKGKTKATSKEVEGLVTTVVNRPGRGKSTYTTHAPVDGQEAQAAKNAFAKHLTGDEVGSKRVQEAIQSMVKAHVSADVIARAGTIAVIVDKGMSASIAGQYYRDEAIKLQPAADSMYVGDNLERARTVIHEYGHHLTLSSEMQHDLVSSSVDRAKQLDFRADDRAMYAEYTNAALKAGATYKTYSDGQKVAHNIGDAYSKLSWDVTNYAPSQYSLANYDEWRAESFLNYVKSPSELHDKCPATFHFMSKLARGSYW